MAGELGPGIFSEPVPADRKFTSVLCQPDGRNCHELGLSASGGETSNPMSSLPEEEAEAHTACAGWPTPQALRAPLGCPSLPLTGPRPDQPAGANPVMTRPPQPTPCFPGAPPRSWGSPPVPSPLAQATSSGNGAQDTRPAAWPAGQPASLTPPPRTSPGCSQARGSTSDAANVPIPGGLANYTPHLNFLYFSVLH